MVAVKKRKLQHCLPVCCSSCCSCSPRNCCIKLVTLLFHVAIGLYVFFQNNKTDIYKHAALSKTKSGTTSSSIAATSTATATPTPTRFDQLVADMHQKVEDHCATLQQSPAVLESVREQAWEAHVEPWLEGMKHPHTTFVHKNDFKEDQITTPYKPHNSHLVRIISQLAETVRDQQQLGTQQSTTTRLGVMDIGVNYGFVTFTLASMGVDVYAFEPMQSNINLLRTGLCLSPPEIRERVTLFEFGLSDKEQECVIASPENNIGDGQVFCMEDNTSSSSFQPPGNLQVRETVKLKPLDEVFPHPDEKDALLMKKIIAIKMDTEGHEPFLVQGGKGFFRQFKVPIIHSEFQNQMMKRVHANATEMMRFFYDELGYQVYENRPQHVGKMGGPGPLSADIVRNMNNFNGLHDLIFQLPASSMSNK